MHKMTALERQLLLGPYIYTSSCVAVPGYMYKRVISVRNFSEIIHAICTFCLFYLINYRTCTVERKTRKSKLVAVTGSNGL